MQSWSKTKGKEGQQEVKVQAFSALVIMGNANSIPNKCDELEVLVRNQQLYKESSLICLYEFWLNDNTPDSCVDIPGFIVARVDRDQSTSGKRKKAGVLSCFLKRDGLTPAMWPLRRGCVVQTLNCCQLVSMRSMRPESSHIQSSSLFTLHRGQHRQRRVTASITLLLGYRPSIRRHSLQSQRISTTSLYPPDWLALYSMWTVQHVEKRH